MRSFASCNPRERMPSRTHDGDCAAFASRKRRRVTGERLRLPDRSGTPSRPCPRIGPRLARYLEPLFREVAGGWLMRWPRGGPTPACDVGRRSCRPRGQSGRRSDFSPIARRGRIESEAWPVCHLTMSLRKVTPACRRRATTAGKSWTWMTNRFHPLGSVGGRPASAVRPTAPDRDDEYAAQRQAFRAPGWERNALGAPARRVYLGAQGRARNVIGQHPNRSGPPVATRSMPGRVRRHTRQAAAIR